MSFFSIFSLWMDGRMNGWMDGWNGKMAIIIKSEIGWLLFVLGGELVFLHVFTLSVNYD